MIKQLLNDFFRKYSIIQKTKVKWLFSMLNPKAEKWKTVILSDRALVTLNCYTWIDAVKLSDTVIYYKIDFFR